MTARKTVFVKERVLAEAGNATARPNEIMIVMAVSDGGRPHPRIGKGRAVT